MPTAVVRGGLLPPAVADGMLKGSCLWRAEGQGAAACGLCSAERLVITSSGQ